MKNFYIFLLPILSASLISWQWIEPLVPSESPKEFQGPVKKVVRNHWGHWGEKDIQILFFDKKGQKVKIKNFRIEEGIFAKGEKSEAQKNGFENMGLDTLPNVTDTLPEYLYSSTTFEYNAKGMVISRCTSFQKKDNKDIKDIRESCTHWRYDANDRLICKISSQNRISDSTEYIYEKADSTLTKTIVKNSKDTLSVATYQYNGKGQLSTFTTRHAGNPHCIQTVRLHYDNKGRVVEEIVTEKGKTQYSRCQSLHIGYWYNHVNQLIKVETTRGQSVQGTSDSLRNPLRTDVTYDYDVFGNVIETTEFQYENQIRQGFSKSIFNENGDLSQWEFTTYFQDENGDFEEFREVDLYEYEYDAFGNWTSKKRFRNGELNEKQFRIIEYWN